MKKLVWFIIPALLMAQDSNPQEAQVAYLLAKIARLEQQLRAMRDIATYYESMTPAMQAEAAARAAAEKACGGEVNQDGSCVPRSK